MIWAILIFFIAVIPIKYTISFLQDNADLYFSASIKFDLTARMLNHAAFKGNGLIEDVNKREFTIHKPGAFQLIRCIYGAGAFAVIWKYLNFDGREVVLKKRFPRMRDASKEQERAIANQILSEMANKLNVSYELFEMNDFKEEQFEYSVKQNFSGEEIEAQKKADEMVEKTMREAKGL
jgi:hypothetical protein